MKIFLSAYACWPRQGSEPNTGWNWVQFMAQQGHEIWLLTHPCGRQAVEAECKKFPLIHPVFVEAPALPLHLDRLAERRMGYFGWQAAAYRAAREILRQHPIELAHHVTYGSLHGGSQLWKLPIPFIFGPVGGGQTAPPAFFKYYRDAGVFETARTLLTKSLRCFPPAVSAVRQAALVLATNTDTLQLVRRMGARRAELFIDFGVPDGYVPATCPVRTADHAELKLLWVGRLVPRKAVRLALEALAQVPAAVPVHLTIIGSGPQEAQLPGWIAELGLAARVDYTGGLPWVKVQDYFRTYDALVFSSLRDSTGMQMAEAMAQAMPVIGLDHQGVRDVVPDGGGIRVPVTTPAQTVAGLTAAIIYLQQQPAERIRMGAVAWQRAREFEWTPRAQKTTTIYKNLLETRRPESMDES